ncbi:MAG TPA: GxxExxY protein [Acetobacteraceae bacterium]|nr:GxxExxY protein [Acetobacteraceae bacterium]
MTYRIIGLAMHVHRRLGPGLLEKFYESCLCYELSRNDIPFRRQVTIQVAYEGVPLEAAYVADIIVAEQVILKIKAVETILPVHKYQLLTYMRLLPCRLGLLLKFNTPSLTDGIRRCIL